MSNYILSCCSTADLTAEHFAAREIHWLPFHYFLDGKEYSDDLGQSMGYDEFYAAIAAGADTRTSQINAEEYLLYFDSLLAQGKDLFHVCLSTGLSGTFNSARIAAEMAAERYPDRKIVVVDSLAASTGFGLLMDQLADLRDAGMSIEELEAWFLDHRSKLHHWFFTTDLSTFIRGGRVSKTSGFVGTLLGICPLLNVDAEGRLTPREKVRSKKKVIARIVEKMEELAAEGLDYSGKCYISHSACREDAEAVAALVRERFPKLNGEILINSIGTTIGSHTGPGTVALFFWGSQDRQ
jgi:DegV family protein with EDD domain